MEPIDPSPSPASVPPEYNQPNQPQYGQPMAELPPLSNGQMPPVLPVADNGILDTPTGMHLQPEQKPSRKKLFVLVGLVLLLLVAAGGGLFWIFHTKKAVTPISPKQAALPALQYNDSSVKQLTQSKQLSDAAVSKLDKTAAFFSAFRLAAEQPVVATTWDVYYTTDQQAARGSQYNLYNVSVDYRSKQFSYYEDDYNTAGLTQSRCVQDKQNIRAVASPTDTSTAWQLASDSSMCQLASAATHMSDGMNTGGLTAKQASGFVQSLYASRALSVDSAKLVTQSGKQYLRFDVRLTPQLKNGHSQGMQRFMDAFATTGLPATTYPYTYFGAGGEGMQLSYYVDPATMLPVYSVAQSMPALNAAGKPVTPTSWSHRSVEYQFPEAVLNSSLDNHPVAFATWPEH